MLIDLAVYRSMPFVVVVIVRTYDRVFLSPSILESIGFHTNRSIAYVTMQDKYTQTKSEKRAKRYQLYSLHTHIRTKAAEHKTIVYCRLKLMFRIRMNGKVLKKPLFASARDIDYVNR